MKKNLIASSFLIPYLVVSVDTDLEYYTKDFVAIEAGKTDE